MYSFLFTHALQYTIKSFLRLYICRSLYLSSFSLYICFSYVSFSIFPPLFLSLCCPYLCRSLHLSSFSLYVYPSFCFFLYLSGSFYISPSISSPLSRHLFSPLVVGEEASISHCGKPLFIHVMFIYKLTNTCTYFFIEKYTHKFSPQSTNNFLKTRSERI